MSFTYDFGANHKNAAFQGKSTVNTKLFIGGQWVDGSSGKTIPVINPTNGKKIAEISEGNADDVNKAYEAAEKAYKTSWGERVSPSERGKLLMKLADLMEAHADELGALETLDNGKAFSIARGFDVMESAHTMRYYGGWADKDHGKVIEINSGKMAYTRHEPIGIVGQIIPWNFPLLMFAWKIGPALATGNVVIMKPSEFTPLTALRMCDLIKEAGIPDGVVNIVNGYGPVVGAAIAEHPKIRKVAFTGSGPVGRQVMKAAASTNLKEVTLELGGKSPNIIFEDADLETAVQWAAFGIFLNHGQACCAGSRVFVQESIYDEFQKKFLEHTKTLKVGDPFEADTFQGPQISQVQYDRIMGYIQSGKDDGADLLLGGERFGNEGYYIQPTVFGNVNKSMKIGHEEIFGPVVVLIKFKTEEEVLEAANDTEYGLASAVFTKDITRALNISHKLEAGTVWVNSYNMLHAAIPFGGYKQSGSGRELGEAALANYTEHKSVHINLTGKGPY